jgi:DNA-binding transcriptional LysR family regulator
MSAMDNLTQIRVFLMVAELGQFSAAAQRLALSKAAVTRHIMQLEESLGARLFERTTRQTSLTPVGIAFLQKIAPALADMDAARDMARTSSGDFSGLLRINAPVSLGSRHLALAISGFKKQHPLVSFDITLNDRRVDPTDEGFDLAIRVTGSPAPTQISRLVCRTPLGVFASQGYLERFGVPAHPLDLQTAHCFHYSYLPPDIWTFREPHTGNSLAIPVRGPIKANNGDLLAMLAVSDDGLVMAPYFALADRHLEGALTPVLKSWWSDKIGVYAVMPSRRYQPEIARRFTDWLVHCWQAHPPWEPQ